MPWLPPQPGRKYSLSTLAPLLRYSPAPVTRLRERLVWVYSVGDVKGVNHARERSGGASIHGSKDRERERGDVSPCQVLQRVRQFDAAFDPVPPGAARRDEGGRSRERAGGASAARLGSPTVPILVRLRQGAARGSKRLLLRGRPSCSGDVAL